MFHGSWPDPRGRSGGLPNLKGRVGSGRVALGQEVVEISRVWSNRAGSDRVIGEPTRLVSFNPSREKPWNPLALVDSCNCRQLCALVQGVDVNSSFFRRFSVARCTSPASPSPIRPPIFYGMLTGRVKPRGSGQVGSGRARVTRPKIRESWQIS